MKIKLQIKFLLNIEKENHLEKKGGEREREKMEVTRKWSASFFYFSSVFNEAENVEIDFINLDLRSEYIVGSDRNISWSPSSV